MLYGLILYCQTMFVSIMEYLGKSAVQCYYQLFITVFELTDIQYKTSVVLLDQIREKKIRSTGILKKVDQLKQKKKNKQKKVLCFLCSFLQKPPAPVRKILNNKKYPPSKKKKKIHSKSCILIIPFSLFICSKLCKFSPDVHDSERRW